MSTAALNLHAPTPYCVGTNTDRGAAPGRVHVLTRARLEPVAVAGSPEIAAFIVRACNGHDLLLALARQYASECAECNGTGIDGDQACDGCHDIRRVIHEVEGHS